MLELIRFLRGYYRIRIRGAAPEQALNRLTKERLLFWNIERIDDFTCDISIRKKDFPVVQELVSKIQDGAELLCEVGLLCHFRGLKRRKAFLAACLLIVITVYVLPSFIWCIRVEGNETIPSEKILYELQNLGIGFGTWGNSIVPQDLKNKMLNRIPQLEWLTVNHSGGLATVIVRERESAPPVVDRKVVTNLVATQDCIITEMEILSGQAVCQVGQTVLEGQLLVSGYADLEHCIQATLSLGEVYGRTWRAQDAVTPATYERKSGDGTTHRRYSLILNGKRINFFQNSGIWGDGCDKMTVYHQLTLPGGYAFPIILVEETATERTLEPESLQREEALQILTEATKAATMDNMIAGEILKNNLKLQTAGGVYHLTGSYECHEMVARSVPAILSESEGTS